MSGIRAKLNMAGTSPYAIERVDRGYGHDGNAIPQYLIVRDYTGVLRLLKLAAPDPYSDTTGQVEYDEIEGLTEWVILR